MATLTKKNLGETEVDISTDIENADNASGDKAANPNGQLYLYFENKSATDAATVTVTAQETSIDIQGYGPLTKADLSIALAAGEQKMVGPLAKLPWNDSDGNVNIAYTGTAAADVDVIALEGQR